MPTKHVMKAKVKKYLIKQCKIMVAIFVAALICSVSVSLIKTADAASKASSNANDDAVRQAFAFATDVTREFLNSADMVDTVFTRYELINKVKDVSGELFVIQNLVVGIATGLVLVYFGIMIVRESMRGDPSMEYWFKILAMLLVTVTVLSNYTLIEGAIDDLGHKMLGEIRSKFLVDDYLHQGEETKERYPALYNQAMLIPYQILADNDMLQDLETMDEEKMIAATRSYIETGSTVKASKVMSKHVKNGDWSKALSVHIQLTLFTFLRIGFLIAIDAQIFFIFMQLLLRGLMMPIALAGIVSEGTRGPGLRYLKRYFALYLQMAVILVIAMCFSNVLNKMMEYANEKRLLGIVALYFMMSCMGAMIAAVSQSSSIANELVGD